MALGGTLGIYNASYILRCCAHCSDQRIQSRGENPFNSSCPSPSEQRNIRIQLESYLELEKVSVCWSQRHGPNGSSIEYAVVVVLLSFQRTGHRFHHCHHALYPLSSAAYCIHKVCPRAVITLASSLLGTQC